MSKQVASPDDFDPKKRAEAEEAVKQTAEHISREDVGEASRSGEEKFRKLEDDKPSALEEVWEDLKTLIELIGDYVSGDYTETPWNVIAIVAATVIYFVSPIDAIPDFIPILGFVDDAAMVAFCMKILRDDIRKYRAWKDAQEAAREASRTRCGSCGEKIPVGQEKCSNPKCAAA
ncbi:MAG: DUF1232 domain-containing protein [Planctomycetes bacterium]|nr:DUF1232 domain-containing protein [Planctomycetota bacterium]